MTREELMNDVKDDLKDIYMDIWKIYSECCNMEWPAGRTAREIDGEGFREYVETRYEAAQEIIRTCGNALRDLRNTL